MALQEFSEYNKIHIKPRLSGSVFFGHLVNCDQPVQNVIVFFGCGTKIVRYHPNIDYVFALMEKQTEPLMYYPTQIPLWNIDNNNSDGTHSIIFVCAKNGRRKQYYLFDPNGYYDDNQASVYKKSQVLFYNTNKYLNTLPYGIKNNIKYLDHLCEYLQYSLG